MKSLSSNDNQVGLALPNLLFLFVMSWGIISSETSLSSPKEGATGIWGSVPEDTKEVAIKIQSPGWEDPFGAVQAVAAARENGPR